MKKNKNNLTEGSIYKNILFFVIPLIFSSLIQQLYTSLDAVIVGRFIGESALAAIDSVSSIFRFPINFMTGLAAGSGIVVSKYWGQNAKDKVFLCIRSCLKISVFLAFLASLAGFIFTEKILDIMSVPKDIYDMTCIYCKLYFLGLWALIMYNIAAGILRALGNTKSPMYVLVLSCFLNIVGDFVLIYIFDMGIKGAALATILAEFFSAIAVFFVLLKDIRQLKITCNINLGPFYFILKILKIGLPLAVQSILFPLANSIIQLNINKLGSIYIASWALCSKIDLLIWLIADSMNPALATFVSQNLGAKKYERIKRGLFSGTFMSFTTIAVCSLVLFFFAGNIAGAFVPDKDSSHLISLVEKYMRMMAPFYVFYSIAESLSGACCGTGDTVKSVVVTLLCTCLLRILLAVLVFTRIGTMECIVNIYISSWLAAALAFILMAYIKFRKLK